MTTGEEINPPPPSLSLSHSSDPSLLQLDEPSACGGKRLAAADNTCEEHREGRERGLDLSPGSQGLHINNRGKEIYANPLGRKRKRGDENDEGRPGRHRRLK
ncbi:unnamed protein product [Pleuronectes platessa]|uniref:Uncharacterized protein n=1 Tax=Pleuronectes platessa TaxID=8262 RepID=A0A9N7Z876_PLEPL|nr:unnamed protein product [Pleuronectes platessa]